MPFSFSRFFQWGIVVSFFLVLAGSYWFLQSEAETHISSPGETAVAIDTSPPVSVGDTTLIGCWSFNGPDINHDGANTASDRCGVTNDVGTLTGGVIPTYGKIGQALDFDGTDDFVSVPDVSTLDVADTEHLFLSGWFNRDTATSDDTLIAKRNGQDAGDTGYVLYLDDSDDKLHFEVSDGTDQYELTSTSTFTTTGWHHFEIDWYSDDEVNCEIYIDDTDDNATKTGTIENIGTLVNALAFRVGAESDAGAPFDGKLDEIHVSISSTASTFVCGTSQVLDADKNVYNTAQIGTQCWMATNMMTTHYPTGGSITRGPTGATWDGNDNAYYAYPPNTSNNAEETIGNIISNNLGFVYQWSAAMNGSTTEGAQGICPSGWHIPRDSEQHTLDNYLKDGANSCVSSRSNAWDCDSAGTKLKTGTAGMTIPLAGCRYTDGLFSTRTTYAYLWSSLQSGGDAWRRLLSSSEARVLRGTSSKAFGFSVRCLKD